METFAGLGLHTLRTAALWEHVEQTRSWDSVDRTLDAMKNFHLRPIVGLLHHGSGPSFTNLLDPEFPEKFAAFALQLVKRYPWVIDYTPINEPQTTGRFSCLYGHWYPHHRNMNSYLRALIHQLKGIVLAMQAIHSVQPEARFIHTEDGGVTYSTQILEPYRLEREDRRWLGLDLLCGRVTRGHPMFEFLVNHGLEDGEILWFSDKPCPPSLVGLNYYVTSDRFLDHRVELYPAHFRGGDTGLEPLVDVDAVRIRREGIAGVGAILRQAWTRYQLPVAVTESHLGGDPAEQVRWLLEAWDEAKKAREVGIQVHAITVWGLLGLYGWDDLCMGRTSKYESGVFDLSNGTPEPTMLAEIVQQLANGRSISTSAKGWWNDGSRLTSPHLEEDACDQAV